MLGDGTVSESRSDLDTTIGKHRYIGHGGKRFFKSACTMPLNQHVIRVSVHSAASDNLIMEGEKHQARNGPKAYNAIH